MRRNKRRAEGDKMHLMLIENIENTILYDSENKKTDLLDSDHKIVFKTNFSDKIDEFWDLPKYQNNESNI